jgi:hypothetical protein
MPPSPIGETPGGSFATAVLVVGLIVVLVALTVAAPGLGILLIIVVAPALIRTAVVVAKKRHWDGKDVSLGEKSTLFLASFAGVLAAAVAAAVAFAVTCVASCFGLMVVAEGGGSTSRMESLFGLALLLATVLGLAVGGFTLHRLWRKKDDHVA